MISLDELAVQRQNSLWAFSWNAAARESLILSKILLSNVSSKHFHGCINRILWRGSPVIIDLLACNLGIRRKTRVHRFLGNTRLARYLGIYQISEIYHSLGSFSRLVALTRNRVSIDPSPAAAVPLYRPFHSGIWIYYDTLHHHFHPGRPLLAEQCPDFSWIVMLAKQYLRNLVLSITLSYVQYVIEKWPTQRWYEQ